MSGEQGAVSGATQGAQAGAAFGPWGAAIGGIVGGIGGFLGGKKAAKKEKKAYERASRILGQLRQTATQSRDLADPFNRHRQGIGNMLNDYVTGRRSIATDPGYQFNLQEGLRSTSRTMRAQGMTQGGSILAALQERGAGIASQQYGSILDRLTNLAGATPQNAIAGGQLFGQLEQARIEGQAQMAIGKGYAGSRGVALQGAALGESARCWRFEY